MTLETSGSQNRETSKHDARPDGETEGDASRGTTVTAESERTSTGQRVRMEDVVASDNLQHACKRVQANKGSPGVDGMTTDALTTWLARNESALREQLLAGRYKPQPVRRVEIPKPGGVRTLGIPTVVDRLVQQALLQIMQPQIDPTFSAHSYGFRPGRSAHQAVAAAQEYVREGKLWVVDVDLEAFFDRVNHDVLMSRMARRIDDKRVLKTLRAFLEAGMMENGVVRENDEGTPQGGPLSPILANILLDEVDKELEARGHSFVRYADDCNVYVRTENAAQRVLNSLRKLYAGLRLKINETKSAAAPVWDRAFLGFIFARSPGESGPVLGISNKARKRFRDQVR